MKNKERRRGFKNKLAVVLSLLCVALMSSVGLASFFVTDAPSTRETSNVSFSFSNTSVQEVSVSSVTITPFTVTTQGFVDSSSNISKTNYQISANMSIVSELTSDCLMHITLTQNENPLIDDFEVNSDFTKMQPTLVIGSSINYSYTPLDEGKGITFATKASTLGFINNGNANLTSTFSLKFTISDTSLTNNFALNVFDQIYTGGVTFALKVELFGEIDA